MAGSPGTTARGSSGWRALATSYRTRLFLAIIFVVAVALGLVLLSLPRLLEGFFLDQERANLRTRADAVATLLADELSVVAAGGARPILLPNEPGISTTLALGDAERGKVRELTEEIARADVTVTLAPESGGEPAWSLEVSYPEGAGGEGQNREASLSATAVATVRDLWYSTTAAPQREVLVTLSNPYTSREQTTRTITEVLVNAALVALVVALITALLLAQWLARPLRRLTQDVTSARRGPSRGSRAGSDELAAGGPGAGRRLQRHGRTTRGIGGLHQRGSRPQPRVPGRRQPRAAHAHRCPAHLQRAAPGGRRRGARSRARSSCAAVASRSNGWTGWPPTCSSSSKLDSGLVALQLREEDLRTVVEDAIDHAGPMADRKGVHLRATLPAEPIVQPHDPPRLGQVLGNLIGNAIKFTPSGGHVEVSVEATEDGARFIVRDDGVGIDPAELEHVFDRFYRGTRRPEERAGGSGLGLAIARSIVDMHSGRVSISEHTRCRAPRSR